MLTSTQYSDGSGSNMPLTSGNFCDQDLPHLWLNSLTSAIIKHGHMSTSLSCNHLINLISAKNTPGTYLQAFTQSFETCQTKFSFKGCQTWFTKKHLPDRRDFCWSFTSDRRLMRRLFHSMVTGVTTHFPHQFIHTRHRSLDSSDLRHVWMNWLGRWLKIDVTTKELNYFTLRMWGYIRAAVRVEIPLRTLTPVWHHIVH